MGLSKLYLMGFEGCPPNEEMAYVNAERAAKAGLPKAEFAMGISINKFYLTIRLFL